MESNHKYQQIGFKCFDFKFHYLIKNQGHSLSGGNVITLLFEALSFVTYLSLYLHRIFKFHLFLLLTLILSVLGRENMLLLIV